MPNPFDEFVKNQIKSPEHTKNYEEIKSEWLNEIQHLYERLEGYLIDYVKSGQLTISRNTIDMFEQLLGSYEAPTMSIGFRGNSNDLIQIKPKGLHVIGARGRVDIEGPRGSAMLVCVPEDSDEPNISVKISFNKNPITEMNSKPEPHVWEWKFAIRDPRIRYQALTPEHFQEVIMRVITG